MLLSSVLGERPWPKKVQFIPCIVDLYDKGGTIQQAGCQL